MNTIIETRHWPYTPKTLEAIAASADFDSIPEFKSRKKRLGEIQKEYTHAEAERDRHNVNAAIAEGKAQHVKLQKAVAAGKTIAPEDVWTQVELKEEFSKKRHAAKEALKALTAEAAILARPILERASEAANDQAADIERADREQHRAFDVVYTRPSDLALTLKHIAVTLPKRLDGLTVCSPEKLLSGLIKL
jgi:hypothetical protein